MANKFSVFPRPDRVPEVIGPDWLCGPVGRTRDSAALERANYDAAVNRLFEIDPHGRDFECPRWGHFGVGWVEEIFTRPGSKCAELVRIMREDLEWYPCLNDELLDEYERDDNDRSSHSHLTEHDKNKGGEG